MGQVVLAILYTDTRLQFAVTDNTAVVRVVRQQHPTIHGDRIIIDYLP